MWSHVPATEESFHFPWVFLAYKIYRQHFWHSNTFNKVKSLWIYEPSSRSIHFSLLRGKKIGFLSDIWLLQTEFTFLICYTKKGGKVGITLSLPLFTLCFYGEKELIIKERIKSLQGQQIYPISYTLHLSMLWRRNWDSKVLPDPRAFQTYPRQVKITAAFFQCCIFLYILWQMKIQVGIYGISSNGYSYLFRTLFLFKIIAVWSVYAGHCLLPRR